MKLQKNAQAAMEFLMTYGWAILIVLVVIGVLSYSGVLGGAWMSPERCVISTGSGLFCEDFAVSAGVIVLKIRNALPNTITISKASISQGEISCNLTASTNPPSGIPITMGADSSKVFVFATGDCKNLTIAGTRLNADISITFTKKYLERGTLGDLIAKIGATGATMSLPSEGGGCEICRKAHKADRIGQSICNILDLVFGEGYQEDCCAICKIKGKHTCCGGG